MALSTLKYDGSFAGAEFIAKEYGAQVMTAPGKGYGTAYTCDKGDYAISTGYYYVLDEYYYFQTTTGLWVLYNKNNPMWSYRQGAAKVRTYTQTQAQAMVQKIINANVRITENNLICARYANKFTTSEKKQIRELQLRVKERNEALKNDGLLVTKSGNGYTSTEYAQFEPYLNSLMSDGSIGISEWVVIVIVVTALAAAGTAVYYAYQHYADQAAEDVKFSDELTATLRAKLTDEEYQQLLDETRGIVTWSRIKQTFSTGSKTAIIVFGITVIAGVVALRKLGKI